MISLSVKWPGYLQGMNVSVFLEAVFADGGRLITVHEPIK